MITNRRNGHKAEEVNMKETLGFPAGGEIQEHLLEPKEGGARTRIAYLYMDCLLSL